jgi:hypothetical protein
MKTLLILTALGLSMACSNTCKVPPATEAPATEAPAEKPAIERPENVGPGTEHAEQDLDACMAECQQQNAMRAVAAEMIEADCRASCTGEYQTLGTQSIE